LVLLLRFFPLVAVRELIFLFKLMSDLHDPCSESRNPQTISNKKLRAQLPANGAQVSLTEIAIQNGSAFFTPRAQATKRALVRPCDLRYLSRHVKESGLPCQPSTIVFPCILM